MVVHNNGHNSNDGSIEVGIITDSDCTSSTATRDTLYYQWYKTADSSADCQRDQLFSRYSGALLKTKFRKSWLRHY